MLDNITENIQQPEILKKGKLSLINIAEGAIPQIIGVLVGGLITIASSIAIFSQEKSLAEKNIQMQNLMLHEGIMSRKIELYTKFINKYGDPTSVSKLNATDIYMLKIHEKEFRLHGESKIADQISVIYSTLRMCGKSGDCFKSEITKTSSPLRIEFQAQTEKLIIQMEDSVSFMQEIK